MSSTGPIFITVGPMLRASAANRRDMNGLANVFGKEAGGVVATQGVKLVSSGRVLVGTVSVVDHAPPAVPMEAEVALTSYEMGLGW